MKIKAYTINAFAKTKVGGNPAGVVLNADELTDNDMKKIARKIGFSETAFVMESEIADFKVRFFTPSEEVDLCGHATIAVFSVMNNIGMIDEKKYMQETKAGILSVEVDQNGLIMMNQTNPNFFEIIDYREIAETLNIEIDDFEKALPCQIVSTGLRDIIVPIKSIDILNSIAPNFEKVAELSRKYDVIGYHMFSKESIHNAKAHCRNLAPLYEIDEEAATGTSSGALACYFYKYNVIDDENIDSIVFEQGYSMGRPSEIKVELDSLENEIVEVKVGGVSLNLEEVLIEI